MPQKVFRMYLDYSVHYVPGPDRHSWRHVSLMRRPAR